MPKRVNKLPTSREGPLLGAVRPAWYRVTESEQRISWLNKMIRKGLLVRGIEIYFKSEHEKLRSDELRLEKDEMKVDKEIGDNNEKVATRDTKETRPTRN